MGSRADDFDVDEWQRLAVEDPQEFERRREAAIRAVIEQAPLEHQARLLQLQFRIDLERRRAKTPLGATVRLQSMMWERFAALRAALLTLTGEVQAGEEPPARNAKVLQFPRPE
jgi:uncharacterized protein DUF3135